MPFQLVYHSQQDPQWKNDILGFGDPGDTIGFVGCALTSVAMLLSGHGYNETPKTLNEKLKNVQGFVSAGIRWSEVNRIHPNVTLKSYIPCATSDAPLAQIDASIAAGQPVIVMVDSSPVAGLQTHWVVVYARKGSDYLMLDPYPYQPGTAKEDLLMPRYSRGNPLQRSIMHVIIYEAYGSGGPIATPASPSTSSTPPPLGQPTPGPVSMTGPKARVKAEVTLGLNIRSSTDTSSMANLVLNVPAGTELLLLEADGESRIGAVNQWVRVREPGGREGFAAAWWLEKVPGAAPVPPVSEPNPSPVNEAPASTTTPEPAPSTPTAPAPKPQKIKVIVKAAGTKIYSSLSPTSPVVTTEKTGAILTVVEPAEQAKPKIGKKGKWINVKSTTNKRGFVAAEKVRLA